MNSNLSYETSNVRRWSPHWTSAFFIPSHQRRLLYSLQVGTCGVYCKLQHCLRELISTFNLCNSFYTRIHAVTNMTPWRFPLIRNIDSILIIFISLMVVYLIRKTPRPLWVQIQIQDTETNIWSAKHTPKQIQIVALHSSPSIYI